MLKIERPDWRAHECSPDSVRSECHLLIHINDLDEIWDTYVEPINKLLSEGVEVVGRVKNIDGGLTNKKYWCATQIENCDETHKALLINITEINLKTREQKLEECLRNWVSECGIVNLNKREVQIFIEAKALLEEGK